MWELTTNVWVYSPEVSAQYRKKKKKKACQGKYHSGMSCEHSGSCSNQEHVDAPKEAILKIECILFVNPLKTSPEYTRAGVYGKCAL